MADAIEKLNNVDLNKIDRQNKATLQDPGYIYDCLKKMFQENV
jgi:hypothetical protein